MIHTLKRLMTVREVHAHCDIPCGIYDPIAAKIAAQTVLKMVVRIDAMAGSGMERRVPVTHSPATWLSRKSTPSSASAS